MKEQLLQRMIRIYGFEHQQVIEFAYAMEEFPIDVLETIVKAHEEFPDFLEDVEDF